MQSKIITVTSPGANGSVAYTGAGFAPVAVIFLGGALSTVGDKANAFHSLGGGVNGNNVCVQGVSNDAAASSTVGSHQGTGLLQYRNASGTFRTNGALTSLDADGFTINWTTTTDVRVFHVLCLGGTDVQCASGNFTVGAAAGNRSVTGLAFQPNTIIFLSARVSTTTTGAEVYWGPMVGFVDSAGNQGSWCGESWDAQPTMVTSRNSKASSSCIIGTTDSGGVTDRKAEFVSYNADGFTVNFSTVTAAAANTVVYYIALNVPFSQVGSFNTRTTVGTTATALTGFTPKALLLGGNKRSGGGDASQDHFFSIGLAASSSDRAYITHHDTDASANSDASTGQNTNAILRWITANAGTPATDVQADVTDMSLGNFTLDYSTVEATARPITYLAMGDVPAVTRIPRDPMQDLTGVGLL